MPEDQQPGSVTNPTGSTPPATPQPGQPAAQPAPTSVQPQPAVQPAPAAQSAQPATTQPQPQQPMATAPQPTAAPVAATTSTQQPSQPATASSNPKNKKPLLFGVVAVVVLAVIGAGVFVAMSLLSGSTITTSSLVADSYDGVAFERPDVWLAQDYDEGKAYILEGQAVDSADQGMLVITESIGLDYNQLSDEQKQLLTDSFLEELSNQETVQDDGCESVSEFSAASTTHEGYDAAFLVQATCDKFQDVEQEGRLKYLIGIAGDQLHGISVVGTADIWDASGEALDQALFSMSPILN